MGPGLGSPAPWWRGSHRPCRAEGRLPRPPLLFPSPPTSASVWKTAYSLSAGMSPSARILGDQRGTDCREETLRSPGHVRAGWGLRAGRPRKQALVLILFLHRPPRPWEVSPSIFGSLSSSSCLVDNGR